MVWQKCFWLIFLFACSEPPRFAPPPDENFHVPIRADLQGEDIVGVSSAVGDLPIPYPPSLRCLVVGAEGKTLLPPLGPLRPVGSYADDLVCQVRIMPKGEGEVFYERLMIFIQANNGFKVPMTEILLVPTQDGISDHLIWFSADEWRPTSQGQDRLTIEAVALCAEPEFPLPVQEEECKLHLVQSIALKEALSSLPEDQKLSKGVKEPIISLFRCAPYNAWGRPDSFIETPQETPIEALRCVLRVENPNDTPIENAIAQISRTHKSNKSDPLVTRVFPTILPYSHAFMQFHLAQLPMTTPGTFSFQAKVGRNRKERNASKQSLSIEMIEAPESMPSSQEQKVSTAKTP